MRLFIALDLPEEEKERLYRDTAPLRSAGLPVRWSRAESLHLTLKFLGQTDPESVPAITTACRTAAARSRPLELHLGGFGAFPTFRNPAVLWLGVSATPQLRMLKQDLEWELAPLGFPRETRSFQPHITLGRARPDARAGDFRGLDELLRPIRYRATIAVDQLELIQSRLSHGPPRYDRIAAIPLG